MEPRQAGPLRDAVRESPQAPPEGGPGRRLPRVAAGAAVAVVVAVAALVGALAGTGERGPSRDAWLRPYDSRSIWNTPIGSDAEYVPAGLPLASEGVSFDRVFLLRASADDPLRPLINPGSWTERCSGTVPTGRSLRVPDDLVIPDATQTGDGGFHTPNNGLVLLRPGGRYADSTNGAARCEAGGPVFGYSSGREDVDVTDLHGDGRLGGHGASRLSLIGGALRTGELTSDEPIRHALDLLVWARHLSFENGGYRWPASGADAYASPETYAGSNELLQMGSLLALPPEASAEELGVTSKAGRKLFAALQDYGAYITDDSAWDHHYFTAESGAFEGVDVDEDEMNTLVSSLQIVSNNAPGSIGGGGEPRRPLLPEL